MRAPLHCIVAPVLTDPSDDENRALCAIMDGCGRYGGYRPGLSAIYKTVVQLIDCSLFRTALVTLLSRENSRERPPENLKAIRKAVDALDEGIRRHGDLVREGIRVVAKGDLSLLAKRGEEGARLVDALQRVEKSATIEDRPLRGELVLLVGYDRDVAVRYNVSYIFRSGLEDVSIVRTSGLDIPESCLFHGTDKLWPDVTFADIANPYFASIAHNQPFFEPLTAALAVNVVECVCALPEAKERRLNLSLPVLMREAEAPLQEALRGASLPDNVRVSLAVEGRAFYPLREASRPVELDVLMVPMPRRSNLSSAALRDEGDFIIAPGQTPPDLQLGGLQPGYDQVVGSGKRPDEIASAIATAARHSERYPPLRGGPRQQVDRPVDILAPPEVPPEVARMAHYPALVDHVRSMLQRTQERGMLIPWPHFINAYWNYGAQAAAIGSAHPDEEKREECIVVAADYMLSTAVMDEKVGDAKEAPKIGNDKRMLTVKREFDLALREASPTSPISSGTAGVRSRMIHALLGVSKRYEATAHPLLYQRCRRGFLDLFQGCADENRLDVVMDPAVACLRRKGPLMLEAMESVRFSFRDEQVPAGIRRRVDELLRPVQRGQLLSEEACIDLAALAFLRRTAPTIGAGLLYRHLSLTFVACAVTDEMIACFERSIGLLDFYMRLLNDLCGPERDQKENAFSVMSSYAADPRKKVAVTRRVSERVVTWLDEELQSHVLETLLYWPAMGRMLQRGVALGRATYKRGHYTLIPREEMLALVLRVMFEDRDSPT